MITITSDPRRQAGHVALDGARGACRNDTGLARREQAFNHKWQGGRTAVDLGREEGAAAPSRIPRRVVCILGHGRGGREWVVKQSGGAGVEGEHLASGKPPRLSRKCLDLLVTAGNLTLVQHQPRRHSDILHRAVAFAVRQATVQRHGALATTGCSSRHTQQAQWPPCPPPLPSAMAANRPPSYVLCCRWLGARTSTVIPSPSPTPNTQSQMTVVTPLRALRCDRPDALRTVPIPAQEAPSQDKQDCATSRAKHAAHLRLRPHCPHGDDTGTRAAIGRVASISVIEAVTAGDSTTCHSGVAMPMWCSPTPATHIDHSNTSLNYATAQPRC